MTGLDARPGDDVGSQKEVRMLSMRTLGGIALTTVLLAGCQADTSRGTTPIALTPGTPEYDMRQQQLRGIQSGANPGMQNPGVTGRSSLDEMQRRPQAGGTGSVAAPIVPGTGRITGGLGEAEVQRQGGGVPR